MSLVLQRTYYFGEFELNVGSRSLLRQGGPIPLGSKAFEVPICLVYRAGQVISKNEMLHTVWPDSFVEESNLAQQVFVPRKALGDEAGSIKTIPGRGYQFVGTVRELAPRLTPVGDTSVEAGIPLDGVTIQHTRKGTRPIVEELLPAANVTSSVPAPQRHLSRRVVLALVFVVVIMIAVTLFAGWSLRHRGTAPLHTGLTLVDSREIPLAHLGLARSLS